MKTLSPSPPGSTGTPGFDCAASGQGGRLHGSLLALALFLPPIPSGLGQEPGSDPVPDPRHITHGRIIPGAGYVDQPYVVQTDDGAWLCVMTTGSGAEGTAGQHVVSRRSSNQGRTWEEPVALEPADGPEASYAVLLKVPYGRVYAFYNHNTDNVREVKREDGGVFRRVDSLGHYVFKYSDDHGRTWSVDRYPVPVREFACDRDNVYGGELRFFWNVGRPLILGDTVLLILHKVGAMGPGFFSQSEGAFLCSPNLLTERDLSKITFATLPDGDIGLRTPAGGGRIAEEQSVVRLSDGSLYCVYRTVDGWPACATSRDGGRTWTPPAYKTYSPDGRRVKNPRAANFVWNCATGGFLYWFHNHGGPFIAELGSGGQAGRSPYDDRNPAWLMAGREVATPQGRKIEWSQPEILLYDDDPFIRMSYPDLIEEDGVFYVTETQKAIGRVHEIPALLLEGLFNQFDHRGVATNHLVLHLCSPMPEQASMPRIPEFHRRDPTSEDQRGQDLRAGFTLDLWLDPQGAFPAQTLVDSRDPSGRGLRVAWQGSDTVLIALNDGRQEAHWRSDRDALQTHTPQHVVITVDGGPKIITFVVNGVLCDGGNERQFGWGRFSPTLRAPNGADIVRLHPSVLSLRLYTRALRVSEAVGNFRAGTAPGSSLGRGSHDGRPRLPAGRTESRMVSSLELLPTALAAAGAPMPPGLDGMNLLPHLTAGSDAPIPRHPYWRMGGRAALREGNWRIHRPAVNRSWELYHLKDDPGERRDLSDAKPARRQALIATFERLDAEMVEPLWGGAGQR